MDTRTYCDKEQASSSCISQKLFVKGVLCINHKSATQLRPSTVHLEQESLFFFTAKLILCLV